MNELPRLFTSWAQHHEELLSGLLLFNFHFDEGYFVAAGKEIATTDFDPFLFNSHKLEIADEGVKSLDELAEHALLITYDGRLIGGSRLHDWARQHTSELVEELPKLMHQTFLAAFDDPASIPFLRDEGGHRGFRAGARQDNGGVSLQVFGECACLNPSQSGYFTGFEGVEKGFAEYELHNTELLAQRISLYAGLGHLAKMASEA